MLKVKDFSIKIASVCLFLYLIYLTFFEAQKWHLLLYSALIMGVVTLIMHLLQPRKRSYLFYSFAFLCTYFVLFGFFSGSAYLQKLEFECTHPHWVKVTAFKVEDYTVSYAQQSREQGHAAIDMQVKFEFDGQSYVTQYSQLHKQYRIWMFESKQQVLDSAHRHLEDAFRQQDFSLYVNPQQPTQTQFILNQDIFSLRMSSFIWVIYFVINMLLVIVLMIIVAVIILSVMRFLQRTE